MNTSTPSHTTTATKVKENKSTIQISAPTSRSYSSSMTATTSSSPIPIAPATARSNRKYSMEEIWEDICLSTLHHPPKTTATPASTGALEGIIFQEFLSQPSRAQYHSTSRHHDPSRLTSFGSTDSGFYESHGQPGPAASTVLSLNSRRAPSSYPLLQDRDLDVNLLDSSTFEISVLPKKRVPQNEDPCLRNKRMIKNRESAARSRARKQAYTYELEIKVARLMEENAKLRRQQKKLCLEAPAQFPKKHMLSRTLTAPF